MLGTAIAFVGGGLVAAAPTATAASTPVTSDYTCSTDFGDQTVTVTTKIALPAKAKKGKTIPAKKVNLKVVLNEGLSDLLRLAGIESLSGSATGAKAKIGTTKVPVSVSFTDQKVPESGPMIIKAKGKTAAFKLKKTGTLKITIPKSFKFSVQNQDGGPLLTDAPCSLVKGEPSSAGSIKVTK